jgi:hypothetical protein
MMLLLPIQAFAVVQIISFSVAAHFRVVEMLLLVGQSVGDTATWSTKLLPFWDLYKKRNTLTY